MAVLSTGPIENLSLNGVRPIQQVTIKMLNRDSDDSATVVIQGYHLNGSRTLYVLEAVSLMPNEVETRNYFANIDSFEFVFTISGPEEGNTSVSVWGKNGIGEISQRLLSDEHLD